MVIDGAVFTGGGSTTWPTPPPPQPTRISAGRKKSVRNSSERVRRGRDFDKPILHFSSKQSKPKLDNDLREGNGPQPCIDRWHLNAQIELKRSENRFINVSFSMSYRLFPTRRSSIYQFE